MIHVAGIFVPKPPRRVKLAGDVARIVAIKVAVLQPDCHIQNFFVGGYRAQNFLGLKQGHIAVDAGKFIGGAHCEGALSFKPTVELRGFFGGSHAQFAVDAALKFVAREVVAYGAHNDNRRRHAPGKHHEFLS